MLFIIYYILYMKNSTFKDTNLLVLLLLSFFGKNFIFYNIFKYNKIN